MKKLLQLILISSTLLLTFSCEGGVAETDPSANLTETWEVRTMTAYDNGDCYSSQLFRYNASSSQIQAREAVDCNNLELYFSTTDDDAGTADFVSDQFCNSMDALEVSLYLQLTGGDSLSTEAAGTYLKTMYAEKANGQDHSVEYSTYGRYYTYGDNMTTQILAKIDSDDGNGNVRVVAADEDPTDNVIWTYESAESSLTMTWVDPGNIDDDGNAGCVVYNFVKAEDYDLKGCTDESASNYFGGDKNDFGITATKETGNCVYGVDEASQPCVKIAHPDSNGDGLFTDDEVVSLEGIIDCLGNCQYAAESAWVGDGICDGGTRSDAYNCEAFNWDGWDCACAPSCLSTYDEDTGASASLNNNDTFYPSQVGEGNGGPGSGSYSVANCQAACKVEDCGYDMGTTAIDDPTTYATWDCCSEACLNSLIASDGSTCSDACNVGECNWYRKGGESIGGCCDQGGPDGIYLDDVNTANIDESLDDIDCSIFDDDPVSPTYNPDGLGGDGKCDEECNSGACNNDGGDCE